MTEAPLEVRSDAIIFFGATGDLAKKQIFAARYGLVREQELAVPIIGVFKEGWTVEQLKGRAAESLKACGTPPEDATFKQMLELRHCVDGDYDDPGTFSALRHEPGNAMHPLHYLAIPPALLPKVAGHLANSRATDGTKEVIEEPFGRNGASARTLEAFLLLILACQPGPARPIKGCLGDAMRGLAELFTRGDLVAAQWRIVDPVLDDACALYPYSPGGRGPAEAEAMIGPHGPWRDPGAVRTAAEMAP